MSLTSVCEAIESNVWSQTFAVDLLWHPVVETFHLIGLAGVIGSITLFDLRLLGLSMRHVPVELLGRRILPWTWASFVLALLSGAMIFSSTAASLCFNTAIRAKFLLIVLAGVNMAVFHLTAYRTVGGWGAAGHATPPQAKLAGACSLLLWLGVVLAGRWIAFAG